MLVKILKKVPQDLFKPVVDQVSQIQWETVEEDDYKKSFELIQPDDGKFLEKTIALFLRSHKVEGKLNHPTEYAKYTESVDSPNLHSKFDSINKLANWIKQEVQGEKIGNIYLNCIQSKGHIHMHIDRFDYFNLYSRYHVPIQTNLNVVYNGGDNTKDERMPLGYLCQFNNLVPHQVTNHGDKDRIHLIVDILVPGGNKPF